MKNKTLFVLIVALAFSAIISGCGGAPTTPTKAPATSAPPAITVIVTATIPPPLPTVAVPTLAPIPTAVITATTPVTTPVALKATPASGTPKPAATKKPTTPATAAVVAPTGVPVKFAAPNPIEPIYNDMRKDERHYPGNALIFKWTAVGGFAPSECYQVNVAFNPGQGDSFLAGCGDQTPIGSPVSFTLNRPGYASPNYSSLLPSEGSDLWVVWYITAVKDLGLKPDGVHHNTAPLSPPSSKVQFMLKGS